MNPVTTHCKHLFAAATVVAAFGAGPATHAFATEYWSGATSSDWFTPSNWTGGVVPTSADSTFINGSSPVAVIDSAGAKAGSLRMGYFGTGSSTLDITGNGSLDAGQMHLGQNTASAVVNQTGANTDVNASTFYLGDTSASTYNLSAGTFTSGSGGFVIDNNSVFNQTGGSVTLDGYARIGGGNAGTYQISGGSFDTGANVPILGYSSKAYFRVIGSGASNISVNNFRYNNTTPTDSHLQFVMDNSANHITPITAAGFSKGGSLDVQLQGGVMLTGNTSISLINASYFQGGTSFAAINAPLWNTVYTNSGKTLSVTLAHGNQGTLDPTGSQSLSFAATSFGYVDLSHIGTGPLNLYLDLVGNSSDISSYIASLNQLGITATSTTGNYNLQLTLDPSVSGGAHFAWDLTNTAPNLTVDSISLATIPEPASWVLCALGGLLFFIRPRNRKNA